MYRICWVLVLLTGVSPLTGRAQSQSSPLSLEESLQILRNAMNSRVAQLGFDIPREQMDWKVNISKVAEKAAILSFHPERGVDFSVQISLCKLEAEALITDATILGPKETAAEFYRDNLSFLLFVPEITYVRCLPGGVHLETRNLTDGRILHTSDERLLIGMSGWLAFLARSQDAGRMLDFLRAIISRQRDAIIDADRSKNYGDVAWRIKLLDQSFPFSILDGSEFAPADREAIHDWLATTLTERNKLKVLEPELAANISRDEKLLARFSLTR